MAKAAVRPEGGTRLEKYQEFLHRPEAKLHPEVDGVPRRRVIAVGPEGEHSPQRRMGPGALHAARSLDIRWTPETTTRFGSQAILHKLKPPGEFFSPGVGGSLGTGSARRCEGCFAVWLPRKPGACVVRKWSVRVLTPEPGDRKSGPSPELS